MSKSNVNDPVELADAALAADDAGSDAIAQRLGQDIHGLRKARGMTLADLAERTGRSVGFLSQIENGLKKPSVGSLQSISDALGISIGWFFQNDASDELKERQFIVRHDQRRRLSYSALSSSDYLGMTDFLASPTLTGQHAMVVSEFAPGASSGDDTHGHGGEESGYVISGIIDVQIGDHVYRLEPGDSYLFESHLPHRYHNPGKEVAVVLMTLVPVALRYGHSTNETGDG